MALKRKMTTAPSAEDAKHYKKISETEWVLEVEGDEEESPKVREFRETTIKERQRAEALEKELAAAKAAAEKAGAGSGEATSLTAKVEHLTKLVESERQARTAAETRSRISGWEREFVGTASKAKVRDDKAAQVLLALAKQTFREDKDGNFVPVDEKGSTVYSPKGTDPLTLGEWMEQQRTGDYRDLFAQPSGGGAKGTAGALGLGGKTPKMFITQEQVKSGAFIKELANGDAALAE